jgi:hypothetical protein
MGGDMTKDNDEILASLLFEIDREIEDQEKQITKLRSRAMALRCMFQELKRSNQ